MGSFISRVQKIFNPPIVVAKNKNALRFGILGAAKIAPLTLITPALTHPDVIVQAVAARDRKKAEEFAQKHSIPDIRDSYQEIIDDPNIDCIFIPLPNNLHFEWAVKAIRAGKHVLLEKPVVANSDEAAKLFNLPELSAPDAPVLLEAFHNRFHPSYAYFRSFLTPDDIVHASAAIMIPWWMNAKDDIYFNHALAGGAMMHLGTYTFAAMRDAFKAEPEECLSCDVVTPEDVGWKSYGQANRNKIDRDFKAKFRFPNGGIAECKATQWGSAMFIPSHVTVTHKQIRVPDASLPDTQELLRTREVTLHEINHGAVWHRIDVKDVFVAADKASGRTIRKWEEKKSHKAYTFNASGKGQVDLPGEDYWTSYRYQLEQFVNKVRGRNPAMWIDGKNSIAQMKMIDMAYEKSGLGPRPSGKFASTVEL
jgi:predicted dehydrogenase